MNDKLMETVRHNLIGCDEILNCKNTRPETRLLYAIDYLEDIIKELNSELVRMKDSGEV